jgi:hypothetical protein
VRQFSILKASAAAIAYGSADERFSGFFGDSHCPKLAAETLVFSQFRGV